MYDELFDDVLFEEYLNDTDILNEDAGGARGKYVQMKRKELEEMEREIDELKHKFHNDHLTDDEKLKLKLRIDRMTLKASQVYTEMKAYDDAPGNKHDPQTIRNNRQRKHMFRYAHGDKQYPTEYSHIHNHINSKAEYEERQKNK